MTDKYIFGWNDPRKMSFDELIFYYLITHYDKNYNRTLALWFRNS